MFSAQNRGGELARVLRRATEGRKSFPVAVAAMVNDSFARGATAVSIAFARSETGTDLQIVDDGSVVTNGEHLRSPIYEGTHPVPLMAGYAFVHHAASLTVASGNYVSVAKMGSETEPDAISAQGTVFSGGAAVTWNRLGNGPGVNANQRRTAERLLKGLPSLLSPRDAAKVTITDENGESHRLPVAKTESVEIDGYVFHYPSVFTDADQLAQDGELMIRFDGTTRPMGEWVKALPPEFVLALKPLLSPWLRGFVEVDVPAGATPGLHGGSLSGMKNDVLLNLRLAAALGDSPICDRVTEQVTFTAGSVWYRHASASNRFLFGGREWWLRISCDSALRLGQTPVWINDDIRTGASTALNVDPFHQAFQVDDDPAAIKERLLVALSEFLHGHLRRTGTVLDTYLELRTAISMART